MESLINFHSNFHDQLEFLQFLFFLLTAQKPLSHPPASAVTFSSISRANSSGKSRQCSHKIAPINLHDTAKRCRTSCWSSSIIFPFFQRFFLVLIIPSLRGFQRAINSHFLNNRSLHLHVDPVPVLYLVKVQLILCRKTISVSNLN